MSAAVPRRGGWLHADLMAQCNATAPLTTHRYIRPRERPLHSGTVLTIVWAVAYGSSISSGAAFGLLTGKTSC
jgi:hypothetical protein